LVRGSLEDIGQPAEGCELFIADVGKGRGRGWVLQGMNEVGCSVMSGVGERGLGHWAVVGKKLNGVGDAFGSCAGYIAPIAPIMFWATV
jgi:hypothetical protein